MDRLDLELYADRLARHAQRLADELAHARLRRAFRDFEADARAELTRADATLLEAVGVLAEAGPGDDDAELIRRRRAQLDALGRLQSLVEERLAAMRRVGP
jgi:hypothetical protein